MQEIYVVTDLNDKTVAVFDNIGAAFECFKSSFSNKTELKYTTRLDHSGLTVWFRIKPNHMLRFCGKIKNAFVHKKTSTICRKQIRKALGYKR